MRMSKAKAPHALRWPLATLGIFVTDVPLQSTKYLVILCRFSILPFQDNSSTPIEKKLCYFYGYGLKSVAFVAIGYYQRPIFRYTFRISRQDFFRSIYP